MSQKLNLLIVDDSEDDALIVVRELKKGGFDPSWRRVDSAASMAEALDGGQWDLIISDHQMPGFSSLGALEVRNKSGKDIPFIIVSGVIGEEVAVSAMKAGGADFVRKDSLARLVPAVMRELEEADVRKNERRLGEELRERDRIFHLIADNMTDTIWVLDMNLKYIYISPSVERIRGYTLDELNAVPMEKHMTPASWQVALKVMAENFTPERLNDPSHYIGMSLDLEFYARDGSSFWDECRFEVIRDGTGKPMMILCVSRNVTERHAAEAKLRESEDKYRTLYETMAQGVVHQDAEGRVTGANPAVERILGIPFEKMIGQTPMNPLLRVYREDGVQYSGEDHPGMEALRTGTEVRDRVIGVFNPRAKMIKWINISAVPQFRPGEERPYQVFTTFTDITDLKEAEQKARYQLMFVYILINAIKAPIFFKDNDGRYSGCNAAFEAQVGLPISDLIGKTLFEVWPAEYAEFFHRMDSKLMEDGIEQTYEARAWHADGTPRDMLFHKSRFNGRNGTPGGIVGVMLDITERKRAERELRESEERMAKAFRSIPEALSISRIRDGMLLEVNDGWYPVLGYRPEEVIGKTSFSLNMFADLDARQRAIDLLRSQGYIRDFESRIRKKSGEIRDVSLSIELLNIGGEDCMITIIQDVTDRKRAEQAVRESERFAQGTVNALDANIAILDETGEIISVNRSWREFALANGADPGSVSEGSNYLDVCDRACGPSSDGAAEFCSGIRDVLVRDRELYTMEYPCHSPSEERWFVGKVTRFPGDGPVRIVVSHNNITERRRSEERIAASLREKEVLLKEIHHRVKNNLQVISSLMGIQNTFIARGLNMTDAMNDMQNRIKSMAIVHEKLYQSENFAIINFRDYIVSLSTSLFHSLGVGQDRVKLVVEGERVTLGIDSAVPCGLVVNELVSNALKHGFAEGRTGVLTISIIGAGDGYIRVSVKDDGRGLPAGFDSSANGTMGMRLINILTRQIGGRLEIRNESGAEFIITFPITPEDRMPPDGQ